MRSHLIWNAISLMSIRPFSKSVINTTVAVNFIPAFRGDVMKLMKKMNYIFNASPTFLKQPAAIKSIICEDQTLASSTLAVASLNGCNDD